jgi:sodium-dependent phosphate cotransporter
MQKIKEGAKLVGLLYLFILSIEIIKKASLILVPDFKSFLLQNITPLKAIASGWFTTAIVQSSGATGSMVATFAGTGLIILPTAIYILIGASLGSTVTAMIISLVTVAKKSKDFRHGFEIALCYSIYSALLVIIVFVLEYFFRFFSGISLFLAGHLQKKISFLGIPYFIGKITEPVINFLVFNGNIFIILLLGFAVLIFVLKFISKPIIKIFGGEENTRKFINRHFDSKYEAYLIGFILTAVVFSSGITVGLLVPLTIARLITLKKAIPFILGADLGTSTDIFFASVILSKTAALASAVAFFLFAIVGALVFLPNINLLHDMTKYTSKKLMNVSRKKALIFLIAFILIPLAIILFF